VLAYHRVLNISPQDFRRQLWARFTLSGALIGLAVGLWESALLYFVPSVREFVQVDASYVIWFLAASIDMLIFALLGAALGCLAIIAKVRNPKTLVFLGAVLIGVAGAHVGWSLHFLHGHTGDPNLISNIHVFLFPLIRFGFVLLAVLVISSLSWRWVAGLFDMERRWPLGRMAKALLAAEVILILGVVLYMGRPWRLASPASAVSLSSNSRPNIVLITLDTVRADHLSAYGYARPTTPNIDQWARRGVLFENAIAPVSWTLPSLASIFTGVLPHQHGGNALRPVAFFWKTLGEILTPYQYETVGFNANYFYGDAGWGIGQGFAPYDDDHTRVEYNLARTLVGRAAVQPVYRELGHCDVFFRRSAGKLNEGVSNWFQRRSRKPYFLYINYLDAHAPYLPPPPYDHRFGRLSEDLARLTFDVASLHSLTPQQRASLVAGYDNSLAYLDAEIGELLKLLSSSPDWSNTIVIITSDHGEAFGEHGAYTHGCDLHREEIHVPLIVFGPRIPSGERLAATVAIRELFSTVLDLALGRDFPLHSLSLARFWEPATSPDAADDAVVSELSMGLDRVKTGLVSLTTREWHYIRTSAGNEELYSWTEDPQEERNLSAGPEHQATTQRLRARLKDSIEHSLEPWLGLEYLYPLDSPGHSFLRDCNLASRLRVNPLSNPQRIGAAQAFFNDNSPVTPQRPAPSEEELLKSLPYQ